MSKVFHFTLRPVQGFVAQARRTRDLWAGSFLLSWLAGQALAKTRRQGGRILFPSVGDINQPTDALLAAIEGKPLSNNSTPQIGSLPNRFKAQVTDDFDAEKVVQAVQQAWRALAEAVWDKNVAPVAAQGQNTRGIWDRQVGSFWETAWVIGDDPGGGGSDADWMEARKNWRDRWPQNEGGDHCALMGDFQELSGYIRAQDSNKQDAFWEAVTNNTGHLELRVNERLCAVALVKRLFPRLGKKRLEDTIGWVPGSNEDAIGNWPSTAYMASIPWLRGFVDNPTHKEALDNYQQSVREIAGNAVFGERANPIQSLARLGPSAKLNGNFFQATSLANEAGTPLEDEAGRDTLLRELKTLQTLQKDPPCQPYYALLILDGDRLGKHLRGGDAEKISTQLADFSDAVAGVVEQRDGVTIYAGGDDVLALVAMDKALDCAVALRNKYGEAFGSEDFTASAAIVFAHYHLPLRGVMQQAHHQLDARAKAENGRDSLALCWLKASGKTAEWVTTWHDVGGSKPTDALQDLKKRVSEDAFAGGFFYHLRARYASIIEGGLVEDDKLHSLLEAEYKKTGDEGGPAQDAAASIEILLRACARHQRNQQGKAYTPESSRWQLDALRFARLLAGKETA